jgi:hypothetical protein
MIMVALTASTVATNPSQPMTQGLRQVLFFVGGVEAEPITVVECVIMLGCVEAEPTPLQDRRRPGRSSD